MNAHSTFQKALNESGFAHTGTAPQIEVASIQVGQYESIREPIKNRSCPRHVTFNFIIDRQWIHDLRKVDPPRVSGILALLITGNEVAEGRLYYMLRRNHHEDWV
jgi:hypothetical protein